MLSAPYTRRHFLTTSARIAGLAAGTPLRSERAMATFVARPEPVSSILDPRIKALALRAVQVAKEAGAEYADVRLTFTRERHVAGSYPLIEDEKLHVGVRALVQGYWGFAASPVWHPDEMVRLGREAASLASVNATGKPRAVHLAPVEVVANGHWETPVRIDVFALHPQEIRDFFLGLQERLLNDVARRSRFGKMDNPSVRISAYFKVQEKAFASTDGAYCTQRLHWIRGDVQCTDGGIHAGAAGVPLTAAGWEAIKDMPFVEMVRQSIDANLEQARLPVKPIDVGRYNTVLDAASVAILLSRTVGAATELDRALGYEANAGGTSYLNDPDDMLGVFPVGNAHLTVTANRNEPGGVATTRWDDEGVEPKARTLVKEGVLHDFQTSREGAGWLRDLYGKSGRPWQSHGGMQAATAGNLPLIHTANLVLQPGKDDVGQQELEAVLGKGMAVVSMYPKMDFQCLNGSAQDFACYEIKGGKRVARIGGAGILFRAPALWKNIMAIGGATSARRWGDSESTKGEPEQHGCHTVTAVPAMVKELSFINVLQR